MFKVAIKNKKMVKNLFIVVSLFFLNSSCSTLEKQFKFSVHKNVIYKVVDGINLGGDIYLPETTNRKGAVVVIHGGGWEKRSGDMQSIAEDLASTGYVVYNITYRLAPEHLYPKAVEDVKDAVRFIKSQSDIYKFEKNQIAAWGYSAGAHLALMAAYDSTLELKAVVSGGTPADFLAWPKSPIITKFIGYTLEQREDLWKQASPIRYVHPNVPPTYLYHGEWDTLVEIDQMEKLKNELEKQNATVETYTASYLGHVAVYLFSQESIDRGVRFIMRYM